MDQSNGTQRHGQGPRRESYIGLGVCMGIILGTAGGAVLGNVGIGTLLGIAVGTAVGIILSQRGRP